VKPSSALEDLKDMGSSGRGEPEITSLSSSAIREEEEKPSFSKSGRKPGSEEKRMKQMVK